MTSLNVPTIDPCIVLLHKGRNEQEFCRITLQCTTNTSTIYLNLLKARAEKETHFQLQVVRKFQFSEEMEKCNAPRFFASFNQCCRFLHAILDY